MMNRKQSLRDHSMTRCPKNSQQTDRGTPRHGWNYTSARVLVSSLFILSNKMLMSLCEKKRFVSSTYMIGFGTLQAWCNHLHIMGTVKVQRWILEEHRMLWSFSNRIIFKRNKIVFGSSNSFQTILDYSKELS